MFDQFYPGQPIQFMEGLLTPIIGSNNKPATLLESITGLGLTSNLKLCLDAGDGASLPAGSTKWLDTSGNGYDFFRGATGSGTDLPTINGTADARTSAEYLSFDGGDFLRYDTTNETWMQNLHKDNAKFSSAGYYWFGAVNAANGIWGDNANGILNVGCRLTITATGALNFNVARANAGAWAIDITSTLSPTAGAWHFIAMSIDEAATTGFIHLDGTNYTFNSTYTLPSAASASLTMEIGARGNADGKFTNTSRMGSHAMWEGVALSTTQMAAVFNATRTRFGI